MPKTKDAFAYQEISKLLRETILDEYETSNFISFNKGKIYIYDFEKHLNSCYEHKGDARIFDIERKFVSFFDKTQGRLSSTLDNFYEEQKYFNGIQRRLAAVVSAAKRLDKHIGRLYRYQIEVLRKFARVTDSDKFNFFQNQVRRVQFYVDQYEGIEVNLRNETGALEYEKKQTVNRLTKYFAKEFGEKIRTARLKKNLIQGDVAELLEIPLTTYSSYERGLREPPLFLIHRLAKILDVSADYLLAIEK